MKKILECASVDPSSGCNYVAQGNTVDEILRDVEVHAKEHGIHQFTPELIARVKAHIRDI
jgi:predicted small metal-binding protein